MGDSPELVEKRKDKIIHQLLEQNHYKVGNIHLYELTLSELEHLYDSRSTRKRQYEP